MKRPIVVILCLLTLFVGCQTATNEVEIAAVNIGTWQGIDEPDIYISVIDYTDELAYCEVLEGSEVGTVSFSIIDLANMLGDGHWRRVPHTEPMLGPPPLTWTSTNLSDKPPLWWVRINGSKCVLGNIYIPLPVHDEIQVTELVAIGA